MDLRYEIRIRPEKVKIKKGVYHPARLIVVDGENEVSVPLPETALKNLIYETNIGWWIRGVQDVMRSYEPLKDDEKDNASV